MLEIFHNMDYRKKGITPESLKKANKEFLVKEKYLGTKLFRYFSPYLTWLFTFLPFTPNQISFLWGIIALIGIFFIGLGGYLNSLIGILIFQFAVFIDYVDGSLARAINKKTIGGFYLDKIFSVIHRSLLLFAIGLGLFRATDTIFYLYLGIFSALILCFDISMKSILYTSLIDLKKYNLIKKRQKPTKESKTTLKDHVLEFLRPNDPLTLVFFALVLGLNKYYLIFFSFLLLILFFKTLVSCYKELRELPS